MKKQLILALAAVCMLVAPAAKAEQNEIMASASGGAVTFDTTNVDLHMGYGYIVNDMWEVTAKVGLNFDDSLATDKFGFSVFAGPRANFGGAINDAYWVGGEVGITMASGSSEFGWAVNAGKRFAFQGNVSYAPFVQYGDNGVTTDGDFSIVPIAFNFTW